MALGPAVSPPRPGPLAPPHPCSAARSPRCSSSSGPPPAVTLPFRRRVPALWRRSCATSPSTARYCPHTQTSWQVNPHAPPGPVAVFGGARSSIDAHLRDQDAHVFLLAVGDPLPPVWITLCGHQIAGAEFDALDPGLGRPAQTATSAGPPPTARTPAYPSVRRASTASSVTPPVPGPPTCPEEAAAHESTPVIIFSVRRAGGSGTRRWKGCSLT